MWMDEMQRDLMDIEKSLYNWKACPSMDVGLCFLALYPILKDFWKSREAKISLTSSTHRFSMPTSNRQLQHRTWWTKKEGYFLFVSAVYNIILVLFRSQKFVYYYSNGKGETENSSDQ